MPWDRSLAAQYARNHAENHSTGLCARYVTDAIHHGGLAIPRTPFAKDMGNTLFAAGFKYAIVSINIGDIAVIQPITNHPYGHVCIYDGENWVSDFIQRTMYPGLAYRNAAPPFIIFRHA